MVQVAWLPAGLQVAAHCSVRAQGAMLEPTLLTLSAVALLLGRNQSSVNPTLLTPSAGGAWSAPECGRSAWRPACLLDRTGCPGCVADGPAAGHAHNRPQGIAWNKQHNAGDNARRPDIEEGCQSLARLPARLQWPAGARQPHQVSALCGCLHLGLGKQRAAAESMVGAQLASRRCAASTTSCARLPRRARWACSSAPPRAQQQRGQGGGDDASARHHAAGSQARTGR